MRNLIIIFEFSCENIKFKKNPRKMNCIKKVQKMYLLALSISFSGSGKDISVVRLLVIKINHKNRTPTWLHLTVLLSGPNSIIPYICHSCLTDLITLMDKMPFQTESPLQSSFKCFTPNVDSWTCNPCNILQRWSSFSWTVWSYQYYKCEYIKHKTYK